MSAPVSEIRICSGVRLNSRYEHSIYFPNASAQLAYFAGKVVKSFTGCTFLRKTWPIKVEATLDQAAAWSYLYFRNSATGKWYFYFINQVEYKNEHTAELSLELDVLQTYMFDYTLLPSFVERQHVEDDTPGKHTQEEGLDPGEYRVDSASTVSDLHNLCIMILTSINVNATSKETAVNAYGNLYHNVFSGLKLYAVPMSNWAAWSVQLDKLSEWGKIDGIVAMWMYPQKLVSLGGEDTWTSDTLAKTVGNVSGALSFSVDKPLSGKIDGHTVRNNKLYCYPYNFLYATNHVGESAVYRYERFSTTAAAFQIIGALSPDSGARLRPIAYNGADSYTEGITLPSFPSCAWDADTYKIWIAQNQATHAAAEKQGQLKALVGAGVALGSLASFNAGGVAAGAGMIYSGYTDIQNLLAAKEDKAVEPPQARGTFSGALSVANGRHTFGFYRKTVTAEYAARIDDFFTMYGYRINRVQVPNREARQAFTYVKTNGCHIAANLCNEDTIKIESIFDKGITWWVNGDAIGDYSQPNNTL